MVTNIIRKVIEKHLVPRESFIYGFADLTNLVDQNYGEHHFGISIGRKLDSRIVNGVMHGPTLIYYNHYRNINDELTDLVNNIVTDLRLVGVSAIPTETTVTTEKLDTEYADTLRTKLSHKMVATRSGLGWIGKSDLLISKEFGPRLRLATILTNYPLEGDKSPVESSRCGSCKICMDRCPAGAISGISWDISLDRDEFFDAFKCREQCRKFGEENLKMNVRVCGICVAVCPFGW